MKTTNFPYLIGITGGIGSGKSVVCKILRALGYLVYDCDSRAKQLMERSDTIKNKLSREFDQVTFEDGSIDRKRLASIVFGDSNKLNALNKIVHGAVRQDIENWASDKQGKCFVETAILYQSGLNLIVDEVWEVTAPYHVRLLRVKERDMLEEEEIMKRIERQDEYNPMKRHENEKLIVNDGEQPILPQILNLLQL